MGGVAAALVAAFALHTTPVSADDNGVDIDEYTLAVTPGMATGGTTTTFTATITNNPGNAESDNGANLVAPAGFRVISASLTAGEPGTAQIADGVVRLRALVDNAGQPLRVRVRAHVPLRCGKASYTWGSSVWEDDDDFPGTREPQTFIPSGSHVVVHAFSPCQRLYALVVSPAAVGGDAVAHLRLALYNRSSRGTQLGSANLTAPPGFKIVSASLPGRRKGSVTVRRGVLRIRGVRVGPGGVLLVSAAARAPAPRCGATSDTWRSAVRQSKKFTARPLRLDAAASKRTTSVNTSCSLKFSTEPHSALVAHHVTGSDYDPSASPVTLQVVDGSGKIVKGVSGSVRLALNEPSGAGATLAGGSAIISGGQATFPNLEVNAPDNNFTLTAQVNGSPTGPTSSAFDVTNQGEPCEQNLTCATTVVSASDNSASVTASPQTGLNSGSLGESIDIGTTHPLDCSAGQNGGYASPSPDTFAFTMSPSTNRTEISTAKLVNPLPPITSALINALLAPPQVCWGSRTEFTIATGAPAPQGILPDGSTGFIGTLPNCVSPGAYGPTGGPCIDQSDVTRPLDLSNGLGFDVIVPVDVPAGQGDPMRH